MTKPTMTKSEVIKGLRGQLAFCLVDSRAFNLYREAISYLEQSGGVMSENEIKAILKEETKGIRSLKYISDIDWEYHYGNIVNALSGRISKPLPPEDKPEMPKMLPVLIIWGGLFLQVICTIWLIITMIKYSL